MAYRASSDNISSVLTMEQIEEINQKRREGVSVTKLADDYSVHRNTIYNVLKRLKFQKAT